MKSSISVIILFFGICFFGIKLFGIWLYRIWTFEFGSFEISSFKFDSPKSSSWNLSHQNLAFSNLALLNLNLALWNTALLNLVFQNLALWNVALPGSCEYGHFRPSLLLVTFVAFYNKTPQSFLDENYCHWLRMLHRIDWNEILRIHVKNTLDKSPLDFTAIFDSIVLVQLVKLSSLILKQKLLLNIDKNID